MVKAGKIPAKINGLRPWIPRSQSGSAEGAATGLRMPEVDQRDIGTCEDADVFDRMEAATRSAGRAHHSVRIGMVPHSTPGQDRGTG